MKHLKYSRPFVQALGFLIGMFRLRFGFAFRHLFVNFLSLGTSLYWMYHNFHVDGPFAVTFFVSVAEFFFILYLLYLKRQDEAEESKNSSNSLRSS